MTTDQLMTLEEVAEFIRIPAATLRFWRHKRTGPKSFKLGPRRVMYRRSDVESWLQAAYDAETARTVA